MALLKYVGEKNVLLDPHFVHSPPNSWELLTHDVIHVLVSIAPKRRTSMLPTINKRKLSVTGVRPSVWSSHWVSMELNQVPHFGSSMMLSFQTEFYILNWTAAIVIISTSKVTDVCFLCLHLHGCVLRNIWDKQGVNKEMQLLLLLLAPSTHVHNYNRLIFEQATNSWR
jgi:hypothetical protein